MALGELLVANHGGVEVRERRRATDRGGGGPPAVVGRGSNDQRRLQAWIEAIPRDSRCCSIGTQVARRGDACVSARSPPGFTLLSSSEGSVLSAPRALPRRRLPTSASR